MGLSHFKRFTTPYRLIILHVCLAFIVECAGWYLYNKLHQENIWLYNIYMLMEFLMLSSAGVLFTDSKFMRRVMAIVMPALSFFWIYNIITKDISKVFSIFLILSFITITVLYINIIVNKALFTKKAVFQNPIFLISISLIIYCAGTVPLYGLMNILIEGNKVLAKQLFTINMVAAIMRYTLLALAIYLYIRQAKREIAA